MRVERQTIDRSAARALHHALVLCLLLGATGSGLAQERGDAISAEVLAELHARLAALLPEARIDDQRLRRALDASPHQACHNLSVLWRAGLATVPDAETDGRVVVVHQSACRDAIDPRPPARLTGRGILIAALDAEGTLIWWSERPDPRWVRPSLMPPTGSPTEDAANRRAHSQLLRAGSALFEVAMPADRTIARLEFYEALRRESTPKLVSLGSLEVSP